MIHDFSFSKANFTEKLLDAETAYQNFLNTPLNSELADTLAQKIWQCTDYAHRENLCHCQSDKIKKCQEQIRKQCKALSAINDICDSAKHAGIDRTSINLQQSFQKPGAFSAGFSCGFDTSALVVVYPDGTTTNFLDIATEALEFIRANFCNGDNKKSNAPI